MKKIEVTWQTVLGLRYVQLMSIHDHGKGNHQVGYSVCINISEIEAMKFPNLLIERTSNELDIPYIVLEMALKMYLAGITSGELTFVPKEVE